MAATRSAAVLADAEEAIRIADQDPGQGLIIAERAARQAHRERHATAAAIAERAWGHALLHCGELDDAIGHLRRSVDCGNRANSPTLVAEARLKLAFAILQRGRPRAALHEIDAALLELDGASAGRARAQRAIILHVIGRLDESLADYELALPVLRRTSDLLGVQRMLINRALVHTDRHAFRTAEQDLLEAERLAKQLGRELTVGLVANNLGLMESIRGDVPAALAHLDRAEQIIAAHGAQLGTLHQDRAELLLSVGVVSEARAAAERAVLAYQREHRMVKVPEVRLVLAHAAFLTGDWPEAVAQSRRAMRGFVGQERPEWAELARLATLRAQRAGGIRSRLSPPHVMTMVETLTTAGWPAAAMEARLVAAQLATQRGSADARPLLAQAAGMARGRRTAALRARGWYAQAVLKRSSGDLRGALRAARSGLRILTEHSPAIGATDLRVHAAVHRSELAGLGLRVAFERGQAEGVFEWSERGRASQLLLRSVRPPNDPELAGMLSELRAVVMEIDKARGAGSANSLMSRQVGLERRIRDHTRLAAGDGAVGPAAPVSPANLSAALGDWALVEFFHLDGELYGITVVEGRVRMRRLGLMSVISDLANRLPFALRRLALRQGRVESDAVASLLRTAAARLDSMLLRPLVEVADRPLVVVPTGPVHSLPWSILPSCQGRPLTVSPSATLWRSATRRLAPSGPVSVVAGPKLAGARTEAEAVAQIYGSTALTGNTATVDAVLASLSTAGVIHLAAHGRLSSDNPLFSEILLADGPLVVYDLERLPRVPHTVVLAACESGRSVVRAGDELLGLSVTFLTGGSAQIVGSIVPVPDAETAPLMVAFHGGIAAGEAPAAALAAAQLSLSGGDPRTAAASAGFVCIGSGVSAILGSRALARAGR